jgi:hypothetical protein
LIKRLLTRAVFFFRSFILKSVINISVGMVGRSRFIFLLSILFCTIFIPLESSSQPKNPDKKLKDYFNEYAKKENVKFFFEEDWIKDITVNFELQSLPLLSVLNALLPRNHLTYRVYNERYIILLKDFSNNEVENETNKVNEETFLSDGKTYSVSGYVRDATTGEGIVGATVFINELKNGVSTNQYGFYSIGLLSNIYNITISSLGKSPTHEKVFLNENKTVSVELFDGTTQLNDVVVTAESFDHNISSPEMSLVRLTSKTLKSMPAFMGEVDIIKSIQLLPGVSSVGEGSGGFNVRGGNVDQNLILMDEVPIFNSSHLFGFFSTFNPDMVKDVTLHKGGIPPQYGGRLSSVLDVKLKEGNDKSFSGSGGIGILSSRLLIEGPIIKNRTSFIVAGRYAYPDLTLKRLKNLNLRNSSGSFYDLNLKLTHRFSEKSSIYLSTYYSGDSFKLASDTVYNWKMLATSLKWNTIVKDKLFISLTGTHSMYNYGIQGESAPNLFRTDFDITNTALKLDLTYPINLNHRIDFGGSFGRYQINPGKLIPELGSSINPSAMQDESSYESSIYVGSESKINERISVLAGVRLSHYNYIGKANLFVYDESIPKSPSSIIDTLNFAQGESIKQYTGAEPRFSLKYSVNATSSIKLSYNRTLQYVHLITNTTAVSPLDLWKSSSPYLKPESANQIAIGYFRNLLAKGIEASAEAYYKEIENMVEYKDGSNIFLNPFLESDLLPAQGRNYGVELLLRKNSGKVTGWIGYTYSRAFRKVKGETEEETINNGEYYPSNFDKPNDLSIVMNYKFTRRLSASANFTYSTGRPITYPQSIYIIDGYAVSQYSERNQGRIPDYHRLDVSLTLDESLRKTQKWKGSWTLSIFNVYGRKNPYSIFFKPEYAGRIAQAYRLSVIGTIFPSLTYNFKF